MASRLSNNLLENKTPYKNAMLRRQSLNSGGMVGGVFGPGQKEEIQDILNQVSASNQPGALSSQSDQPIENKYDFEKSFAQGLSETQNKAITNLILKSRGLYTNPLSYLKNMINQRSMELLQNPTLDGSFNRMMGTHLIEPQNNTMLDGSFNRMMV